MKVSLIITNGPPLVGGLERVCLRVAQHLQTKGHEVQILARYTADRYSLADSFYIFEEETEFCCEGVKVKIISPNFFYRLLLKPVFKLIWRRCTFPFARMFYTAALSRNIRKKIKGSSVVHFFGNGPEMLGFAAESAARSIGAKFVVEPALHEGQWGDHWFDALLYRRADLLFAHTRYEAEVLGRMGMPLSKIRPIVHGLDFCQSGEGLKFRMKHDISGPMVLFLGRKTREKGVMRLLQAWPMVAEKFPEATLVFAGPKSEDFEKLKSEIRDSPATSHSLHATAPKSLNLNDLTEGEKQDALAACDLLCVPSEGESFGMVYFEALAYKKPVMALDLPVLRETLGDVCYFVPKNADQINLAACITDLLENPKIQKELVSNAAEVCKKHDWSVAIESYINQYK